jgi:hypothetical protein
MVATRVGGFQVLAVVPPPAVATRVGGFQVLAVTDAPAAPTTAVIPPAAALTLTAPTPTPMLAFQSSAATILTGVAPNVSFTTIPAPAVSVMRLLGVIPAVPGLQQAPAAAVRLAGVAGNLTIIIPTATGALTLKGNAPGNAGPNVPFVGFGLRP